MRMKIKYKSLLHRFICFTTGISYYYTRIPIVTLVFEILSSLLKILVVVFLLWDFISFNWTYIWDCFQQVKLLNPLHYIVSLKTGLYILIDCGLIIVFIPATLMEILPGIITICLRKIETWFSKYDDVCIEIERQD